MMPVLPSITLCSAHYRRVKKKKKKHNKIYFFPSLPHFFAASFYNRNFAIWWRNFMSRENFGVWPEFSHFRKIEIHRRWGDMSTPEPSRKPWTHFTHTDPFLFRHTCGIFLPHHGDMDVHTLGLKDPLLGMTNAWDFSHSCEISSGWTPSHMKDIVLPSCEIPCGCTSKWKIQRHRLSRKGTTSLPAPWSPDRRTFRKRRQTAELASLLVLQKAPLQCIRVQPALLLLSASSNRLYHHVLITLYHTN